jgi:hypothetical protein
MKINIISLQPTTKTYPKAYKAQEKSSKCPFSKGINNLKPKTPNPIKNSNSTPKKSFTEM